MTESGVNALRTYTVPPEWLLDLAAEHDLYVMVGLPWEEHITFLDDPGRTASIEERIRAGVRACAGHPAVLCYAVGNEIPASIVRWHGPRKIERFIRQVYRAAKDEDPDGLVTYVNYPSTEYLELPFIDLVCFNVFLEVRPQFESYLARLQNIAGDRPLLVTEAGLDSRTNSEEAQARAVDWQIRSTFGAGCAGIFVFSWTDEWHRGGYDVEDWDFGVVGRDRRPKAALAAVRKAFTELPFPDGLAWPRVTVVVCTYNAARTLPKCLDAMRKLDYPDYEVIVVNDGSTDETDEIVNSYGFRLISTDNRGLACARNLGLQAATGEIVAYIDSDAYPDPHWLSHLAVSFLRTSHAGVGGPNIPPSGDGLLADCVSNAPGGPIHVLLSDREAEHIPGCNMAFRKASLEAIGGFDPQFCVAGDDVDICWRLQAEGWTVGFSPGAVVWHHRRSSVRGYLRQQYEYGKAEALLERKWPEKYNRAGHLTWAGRVYGNGGTARRWRRWKIYYGMWGSGLFQSLYQGTPSTLASLPLVPEWYLVVIALAGISALGALWAPLLLALPLLVLATGALIFEAAVGARRATFHDPGLSGPLSRLTRARLQAITLLLYTLQPLARLTGRLRYGLAPWRRRAAHSIALPRPRTSSVWSEQWLSADQRMRRIAAGLRQTGAAVLHGGEYDRWDLQVRGGILGVARMRMAVEEHGGGRQLVRFGSWPKTSLVGLVLTLCFAALAVAAISSDAIVPAIVMGAVAAALALFALRDCATSTGALLRVLERQAADSRLDAEASLNGKVPARAYAELSRSSEALGEIAHHAQRNGHDDGVEHPATAPASARMLQMSRDRDKEARARQ